MSKRTRGLPARTVHTRSCQPSGNGVPIESIPDPGRLSRSSMAEARPDTSHELPDPLLAKIVGLAA